MKKVVKNYFYNIIYQIISLLTPLITAPYITRTLGGTMIGISNFANSIVYWFILFGMLGIRIYGNREIAKCGDDKEKRSKIFWEIFIFQIIALLLGTLIYYSYFLVFPVKYQLIFLIYGLTIIGTAFDISWLYVGLEDFKKITIRDFFVKILNITFLLVFIKKPDDVYLFVAMSNIFYLLSQLIMWFKIRKYINFTKVTFKGITRHIKPNFFLFVPQIAISVYSMLDQTMIGLISPNISEVAYYNYAQKFVHMFLFITTSIGTVMMPHVARLNITGGKDKVVELIRKTCAISLFLAIPVAFGLASIAPFLIPWLLTKSFIKTGYLIVILAPIIMAISLSNVLGVQYLIPLERTKEYTKSVTIGCIVNLILNFILIPLIGAYGAAIASVIAETTVFAVQFHYTKKEGLFINFRKKIKNYLLSAMLMSISMVAIGVLMKEGIVTAIVQFLVGSTVYFGMLYILKDEVQITFIDTIKGFLIKKFKKISK